jgi:hypothetical protein
MLLLGMFGKRDSSITVKFPKKLKEQLVAKAKDFDMTLSQYLYITRLCHEGYKPFKLCPRKCKKKL